MSIGTADASVRSGATTNPAGAWKPPGEREAVPLIVRRRSELAGKIVGIDRTAAEWNLIVVGVVGGLGERVRRRKPKRAPRRSALTSSAS